MRIPGAVDDVAAWDSAAWLWPRIRAVFPDAVANLLMPDHTHTLTPCDEVRGAAFRRVLQDHGRVFGTRWDVADPQPVHSRAIARRAARYILLNPVRADSVADPLQWPWSTLRDALGLTHDPWGQGGRRLGYTPAQLWRYTVQEPTQLPWSGPAAAWRTPGFTSGRPPSGRNFPNLRVEGR